MRAKAGVKFFGCRRIGRETLDIDIESTGWVDVEVILKLLDQGIKQIGDRTYYEFKFYYDVELDFDWSLDDIDIDGCDIRLFGRFKIGSYCGIAERLAKKYAREELENMKPDLRRRIEKEVAKNLNEQYETIRIPLDFN